MSSRTEIKGMVSDNIWNLSQILQNTMESTNKRRLEFFFLLLHLSA